MTWFQRELTLPRHKAGIHLITHDVVNGMPQIATLAVGLAHIHLLHTSAALTLNEAVEPEVRADMDAFLDRLVPPGDARYTHVYEGPDDMPAHIKAVLVGPSLTLPIRDGRLVLGTWQGIYLCEFRRNPGQRRIYVTIQGDPLKHVAKD